MRAEVLDAYLATAEKDKIIYITAITQHNNCTYNNYVGFAKFVCTIHT